MDRVVGYEVNRGDAKRSDLSFFCPTGKAKREGSSELYRSATDFAEGARKECIATFAGTIHREAIRKEGGNDFFIYRTGHGSSHAGGAFV